MQRRHLRFSHLDQARQEILRLDQGGYDRVGNWELPQIVDHLIRTMRMATDEPPFMFPAPVRMLARWMFLGKIRRGDMLKVRGRAPVALRPAADSDLEVSLAEFASLAARIESADAPLQAVHPVFGRFTREDWQLMQRWHAAHHLGFLLPRE